MQVGLRRLDGFMPEPQRDHGAGCATEAIVRRAALSALERGYRVQVPVDARDGLSAPTENAALHQIEAAGGASILARCARLLGLPMLHSVVPQDGKAPWRSRATRRRSSRCPRRSGLRCLRGSWRHCRGHLLAHGLLDHGPTHGFLDHGPTHGFLDHGPAHGLLGHGLAHGLLRGGLLDRLLLGTGFLRSFRHVLRPFHSPALRTNSSRVAAA
jgi:isochorismatase family protein